MDFLRSIGRLSFHQSIFAIVGIVIVITPLESLIQSDHYEYHVGCDPPCYHGYCSNSSCICYPGWGGKQCQFCRGKIRIEGNHGWLSDGPGNYTADMMCTWLLQANQQSIAIDGSNLTAPPPIILRFEEFATECGWDHLYIYDGDNTHAPLIGVFSGILMQNDYKAYRLPEVVATSGFALIHFYTDVAYNLTGFNITYRTNRCLSQDPSKECSGNGVCLDGVCTCNAKYTGAACEIEKCPRGCSDNGFCDMEIHRCRCNEGYKGWDCSQLEEDGYWELLPEAPMGFCSHASTVYQDQMFVVSGHSLDENVKHPVIQSFDLKRQTWTAIETKGTPAAPKLHDHSIIIYKDKLYLYGGVHEGRFGNRYISKTLWTFDLKEKIWSEEVSKAHCRRNLCVPLAVVGHTAMLIDARGISKMVVISGYSPNFGYLNIVQEFNLETSRWSIAPARGYPFAGRYGHSSSWDQTTEKIYIYGGYEIGMSLQTASASNTLYAYDPFAFTWTLLKEGPSKRFLHVSSAINSVLIIYGGNSHNDTSHSMGSKCFAREVYLYDILCDEWEVLGYPANYNTSISSANSLDIDLARYGFTAEVYNDSVYLYGGFNGLIQNDLIKFTPPDCSLLLDEKSCNDSYRLGSKCYWNDTLNICHSASYNHKHCEYGKQSRLDHAAMCSSQRNCQTCLNTFKHCHWCADSNTCWIIPNCYENGGRNENEASVSSVCNFGETECSAETHSCNLCASNPSCLYLSNGACIRENLRLANGSTVANTALEEGGCPQSCYHHSSCHNCTSNNCMWCNNLSICIEKNAYVVSFPYGQCMSWSQIQDRCLVKTQESLYQSVCKQTQSCDGCLSLPSCGWCDDDSGTGVGECMDGSSRGPQVVNTTGAYLNQSLCATNNWFFTGCPKCQCNGHSLCNADNRCSKCEGHTDGKNCERCMQGYFGNALNGGSCQQCECNGQAESCLTVMKGSVPKGKCLCTTKGVTGDDCSRCDTKNDYVGNPLNGTCFYMLQIDYQFTFDLSQKEDRYFRRINFRNSPPKGDIDADFQIHCSMPAKMNLTVVKNGLPEKPILVDHNCTSSPVFKSRFSKTDYNFGEPENTTFFVYVYDFTPPLMIKISFAQAPKLDLLHFFITFSTCFLLLLMAAAVLWKIKQRYDIYRRRQRLFVEMEQMASRPFAQVFVEIGKSSSPHRVSSRRKKKENPSPVSLEPCSGNRAAVLSLIISLPSGSQTYAPPGQSGLSIGSVLVALGNTRKVSYEPITKTEIKSSKLRKSLPSRSLNTCI